MTSKPRVARRLRRAYGLDVSFYKAPGRYEMTRKHADFRAVLSEQLHRDRAVIAGRLFLVGAGVWGKIYAAIIKQHGGYAIDIGSMVDYWSDEATRPHATANILGVGESQSDVPDELAWSKASQFARLLRRK